MKFNFFYRLPEYYFTDQLRPGCFVIPVSDDEMCIIKFKCNIYTVVLKLLPSMLPISFQYFFSHNKIRKPPSVLWLLLVAFKNIEMIFAHPI